MTGDHRTSWPHVPRRRVVAELSDEIRRRPGIVHLLCGPAGVGKSALARSVAEQCCDVAPVLVLGLAEQSSVPLGAFSAHIDQAAPLEHDHAVSALVRSIGSGPTRPFLLVDDATRIDALSAEAVSRLVTGFGATVLATARAEEKLPSRLRGLDSSDLLQRHKLDGLELDEIADLLEQRFRLPVGDEDVRRLAWATDGNALHLRLLVESAIDDGRVLHRGTHVEIASDRSPTALATLIDTRVSELNPAERHALCLIAMTQPVSVDEIIETFDAARSISSLVRGGLLTESSGLVSTAHPLIAEAIERGPQVDRTLGEAVRLLRRAGTPARRFRAAEWELTAGRPADPAELTWAAGYATSTGDASGAARLAAAAAGIPGRRAAMFAARLAAGAAASALGDLDTADSRFAEAEQLAESSRERISLVRRRGEHLAFRRGDPDAAVAQAELARRELAPTETDPLEADLWRWRTLAEEPSAVEVRSAIAATVAAAARGEFRVAQVHATTLTASRAALGDDAPIAAIALGVERVCALRASGDAESADAYLESMRAEAHDEVGFFTAMLAWQRAQDGRLGEARALADLGLEQLRRWDGGEMMPFALAVRAAVAAQLGDDADAARRLEELDADGPLSGVAVVARAECEAFLAAGAGDTSRAADVIVRTVDDAIDSSYDVIGALTLANALRFGDVERAARVAAILCDTAVERLEPAAAIRDAAAALAGKRVDRVIAAATRLVRSGLTPCAVDTLVMAARADLAVTSRRRLLARAIALRGGIDAPTLQPVEQPLLTPRELDVARAAAARHRSREIADDLGVSVRTVDNQLQAAYRKLGVRSRDELREVLEETGLLASS